MSASATPDVSHFNSERMAFSGMRRDLRDALKGFSPPPDVDEHIISYAEEFGAEHAAKALAADPKQFELRANPNDPVLVGLKTKIKALHESNQRMDSLIIDREAILDAANTGKKRDKVYQLMGREFTLDMANKLVR